MYRYGMRSRGFSPLCQPMDGLIGNEPHDGYTVRENGRDYYDIICYDRKLTERETEDFQLDYLGE